MSCRRCGGGPSSGRSSRRAAPAAPCPRSSRIAFSAAAPLACEPSLRASSHAVQIRTRTARLRRQPRQQVAELVTRRRQQLLQRRQAVPADFRSCGPRRPPANSGCGRRRAQHDRRMAGRLLGAQALKIADDLRMPNIRTLPLVRHVETPLPDAPRGPGRVIRPLPSPQRRASITAAQSPRHPARRFPR